ncbi:MAG: hypothetical protein GY866_05400 [Proteobacteria bacterium]|nr:hypothetical protein [Pseudomonadota bacterium]
MKLTKPDLAPFFNPKSIAIIGVSSKNIAFGGTSFLRKLLEGAFAGNIYPINPKAETIQGLKAYPDLASLPEVPDLAMVCIAAHQVPAILEECAGIGLKHIHILTSGFKEIGTREGIELEDRIASIAREKGLLVVGPNCMGVYCPSSHLTAWGAIPGLSGPLGVISQSGGITQRLTEYLCSLGIGVDKAVSIGNSTVLDCGDFLEFMAGDPRIEVIAIYLESTKEGRELLDLARVVSAKKPIVLLKGGKSAAGAATVASHTGAMTGELMLWEAFYKQSGVISVSSLGEWFDALVALCRLPAPSGKGVFIASGGGGNSVTYSDKCVQEGLEVPVLSDATMEKLRRIVPATGSIAGNPLDSFRIFQDASHLAEVMDLAYQDPSVSMIIADRLIPRKAYHLPDLPDSTPEIIDYLKSRRHQKPTILTIDSDGGDAELAATGTAMRAQFCRAGIPAYPSLDRAARALVHLYEYYARRRESDENSNSFRNGLHPS